MNIQDPQQNSTQPLPSGEDDLGETLPPTQIPMSLRSEQTATEPGNEPTDRARLWPGQEGVPYHDRTAQTGSWPPSTEETWTGRQARQPSRALTVVMGLCLFVSLLSLALSGFLLYSLLSVRLTVVGALDAAISTLDKLGGDGFHYQYRLQRAIPFSAEIPFEQELVIPFEGTFPINTTVEVPINTGLLGTIVVEVPIDTSIYVSTSVPVRVEETFHVSTTIPISMTVPIDIPPDDPAVQGLLGGILAWLVQLRGAF